MATLTTNTNFLSPVEFQLVLNRLPNVEFFVQGANIPGINSGGTEIPTPFKIVNEPSDRIAYEDFVVTVVCDEDMVAFKEVSDWIVALTAPDDFTQYADLNPRTYGKGGEPVNSQGDGVKSDGTLIVMNSNKNSNLTIQFFDMFPISVGSVELNTSNTDLTPPTFDVTFKYNKYTIAS